MTDDVIGSGEGTFVIAGVTFREGAPAVTKWSSGRVSAVAPVDLVIAAGVTATIDVAHPSEVLDVEIASFGDPARLVEACEPGASSVIDAIMSGTADADVELTLRPDWARRALVDGVSRWLPTPLHQSGLLLDEAGASAAVGELAAAARLAALGLPVLQALAADAEDGFLTTATIVVATDTAQHITSALTGVSWGDEVAQLTDRITGAAGLSDLDWAGALAGWSERDLLIGAGASSASTATGSALREPVDPVATMARVIKWDGGRDEIRVRTTTDGADVVAELDVDLSPYVDDRCHEVARVTAFVADSSIGAVLRTARTHVDGRTLRATLRFQEPPNGRLVFGLFDADEGIGSIRVSRADRSAIKIDRMMLDAWSFHRAALVQQMHISGAEEIDAITDQQTVSSYVERARRGVENAQLELVDSADGSNPTPDDSARLRAVERYLDELQLSVAVSEPGCGPLLAELLPISPEVDQ